MKIRPTSSQNCAGILLVECLVYMTVFFILFGIAMTAFYFCWDHSKALIYAADDVSSALRAGERWRADVRGATGEISVETAGSGEVVKIPEGEKEIIYLFNSGELRRQATSSEFSELLLPRVKSSQMEMDPRGNVKAWRWELELAQRRKEMHLPLLFTFEAAQTRP